MDVDAAPAKRANDWQHHAVVVTKDEDFCIVSTHGKPTPTAHWIAG